MNNSWKFVLKKYSCAFVFKKIFVCIRVYSCVFVLKKTSCYNNIRVCSCAFVPGTRTRYVPGVTCAFLVSLRHESKDTKSRNKLPHLLHYCITAKCENERCNFYNYILIYNYNFSPTKNG